MRRPATWVCVLSIAAVLLITQTATADTVTLREGLNGYSGTTDLLIKQSSPNSNQSNISYGSPSRLVVDIWGSPFPPDYLISVAGAWSEGMLKFGNMFDGIDPSAVISSATLTLYIVNPYEAADMRRITTPWTEANASWNHFDTDSNGTNNGDSPANGGGLTPGVNTLSVPDFSSTTTIQAGSVDIDVTDAVKAWFADPSSNHGWAFFMNGNSNRGMFVTSEDSGEVDRPTLTIEFSTVPEPSTISLMIMAAVCLFPFGLRRLRQK